MVVVDDLFRLGLVREASKWIVSARYWNIWGLPLNFLDKITIVMSSTIFSLHVVVIHESGVLSADSISNKRMWGLLDDLWCKLYFCGSNFLHGRDWLVIILVKHST